MIWSLCKRKWHISSVHYPRRLTTIQGGQWKQRRAPGPSLVIPTYAGYYWDQDYPILNQRITRWQILPVSWSLVTAAVRPTPEDPRPVVDMASGAMFIMARRSCDLATEGSPTIIKFTSLQNTSSLSSRHLICSSLYKQTVRISLNFDQPVSKSHGFHQCWWFQDKQSTYYFQSAW